MVKDIVPGSYGSVPYNLTNVNGTLFFDASQDNTGNDELFKSDGTDSGHGAGGRHQSWPKWLIPLRPHTH